MMSTEEVLDNCAPTHEARRVADLWFHDGTLVLATETLLFRIYAGLLAKESPIFHDMLGLPQPKEGETMDGCPVVHLSDTGQDVEYFLKALFDYKFFLPFPNSTTFDIMTGIMRLSKKYEVDSLHKRALVHFASAFPLEAAEYPSSASWDRTDQDMRAVIFAREQALDWALPTAFYRVCAHSSVNEILNGIYVGNARVELNPKDKLMCLEQSVLLRGSASADVINFLWHPDRIEGCRSEKCRAERIGCRKIAEDWRARHFPITLWEKKDWDRLRSVCSICLTAMKTTHKGTIEKFWDGLPKRFGLVAWDELEEMKANLLADPNSLVPTESLLPSDDVINA